MMTTTTAELLSALSTLYTAPDRDARRAADAFLDSFQKSRGAWDAALGLLEGPGAPPEARVFAGQTVKVKCIYDLATYPNQGGLQSRLLALFAATHDERAVSSHLAVGLAALALQSEWTDPITDVVNTLSPVSGTAAGKHALAEFLRALPEEGSRDRYRGADGRWKQRGPKVVEWVVSGLSANPENSVVLDTFGVLRSWISDGDLPASTLLPTAVIPLIFSSLTVPELADPATDLAVDLVDATHNAQANMEVIKNIYPRILGLRPLLDQYLSEEDEEATRGLCRIFASAGENYLNLIVAHPADFDALVRCLLDCAKSAAEVSKITFRFWFELADKLAGRNAGPNEAAAREHFRPVFRELAQGMLAHLRYPPDSEPMTAQERDEFRDFRHDMGDVIKDCALVLGAEEVLSIPYNVLAAAEGAGSWQELEAPLFFLRAVGAKVPDDENTVLPRLMGLLPNISPSHPKLRYAALLVIGRYASWTAKHGEFIPFQLTFVAEGFSGGDADCKPAATQAFLFLCESCGGALVPYLPQLHPFYVSTLPSLQSEDRMRMAEAVSNVLVNVSEGTGQWIGEFLLPVAQRLHTIAGEGVSPDDEAKVKEVADLVSQLATFIKYLRMKVAAGEQHPLIDILSQMWPILSPLMTSMGNVQPIATALSRLFVNCINYLGLHFLPLLPPILSQLVEVFERTGDPAYLWVCKVCIEEHGEAETEAGKSMASLFRTASNVAFRVIEKNGIYQAPDLVEEYFSTVSVFFRRTSKLSALLPVDFLQSLLACTIFCVGTEQPETAEMVYGAVKDLYLSLLDTGVQMGHTREALQANGQSIVSALLNALLFTAPREFVRDIGDATKAIVDAFPAEGPNWLDSLVRQIPDEGEDKEAFLGKLEAACMEPSSSKLMRNAMQDFASAYRRNNLAKTRSKVSLA